MNMNLVLTPGTTHLSATPTFANRDNAEAGESASNNDIDDCNIIDIITSCSRREFSICMLSCKRSQGHNFGWYV